MDLHGLLYLIRLQWELRLWLQEGTNGDKPPDKLSSSWTDRGSHIPAWGQLCEKHHVLRTLSFPQTAPNLALAWSFKLQARGAAFGEAVI